MLFSLAVAIYKEVRTNIRKKQLAESLTTPVWTFEGCSTTEVKTRRYSMIFKTTKAIFHIKKLKQA